MTYQDLLSLFSQSGSVVSITVGTAPSLAAFLSQYYLRQGSVLLINNAVVTQNQESQTVQITGSGTADFLNVASAPVSATLSLNSSANPVLALTYTMLDPAGPTGWKFSTSFRELPVPEPEFIDMPLTPRPTAPKVPLLDTLPLVSARLRIASAASFDPTSGTTVPAGISFLGQVSATSLMGVLNGLLGAAPIQITGTILFPADPLNIVVPAVPPTVNLGATEAYPWDLDEPLPGIHLQADLGQSLSLGAASITGTAFRIYSPLSASWPYDPLLQPVGAITGTLSLPSAGISATAIVSVDGNAATDTSVSVSVRCQGLTIANLAKLADLAGSSNLAGALPSSLTNVVQGISSFGLTELSFSISAGSSSLELSSVGITLGAPGVSWSVWNNGQISVSNLALGFRVLSPMSSPHVSVTVQGTSTIAGAAVNVKAMANLDGTGILLVASLQDGLTLPLGNLLSTYLPGLSGIVAPSALTIDTLSASLDSSGLRFAGAMAQQQSQPWTVDIGPTSLQISNITFDLNVSASGSASGRLGGTLDLGGVSLTLSQQVPGPVKLVATCPSVNLGHILSSLSSGISFLPSGFDFTLSDPSILIQLGTSPSFQVAAQVAGLGTVVLQAMSVNGTWGCVFGIALSGKMTTVPGLSALAMIEDLLGLDSLVLVAASVAPSNFSFPALSSFNNPSLGTTSVTAPSGGLIAGLNVYGSLTIGNSPGLAVVQKFLGMSPDTKLTMALQISQNPMLNSSLTAGIIGKINSSVTLDGSLGLKIQNGSPALSIGAKVTAPIDGKPCEFSSMMILNISPPGGYLAGSMLGSVTFYGITLSNPGLLIGVSAAGLPSLGVAATVSLGKFNGSVAMFFDSANPSRSMLAGSVSDLSLKDVADTMAGVAGFSVPADIGSVLSQVQVSGTQQFDVPTSYAADLTSAAAYLDEVTAPKVAAAMQSGQITVPSDPKKLLITASSPPGKWFVTDLSLMRHYSLVQGAAKIKGSIDTQLYVAPQDTMIGALAYPQGFYLNGKLTVYGRSLTAKIVVSKSQGISVDASMSPIVIKDSSFFSLTSADGTTGPLFSMSTYQQDNQTDSRLRPPHLLLSGKLSLLGCSQSLYVLITTTGMTFSASFKTPNSIVAWTVTGNLGSDSFSASGALVLNLKDVPPLDLGSLGKLKLDNSFDGTLFMGFLAGAASVKLSGQVTVKGTQFKIDPPVTISPSKLEELPQLAVDALKLKIDSWLHTYDNWLSWVEDGLMQGFSNVQQLATTMRTTFGQNYKAIATKLKWLGHKADAIADAFKAMGQPDWVVTNALKAAEFYINDIGSALKSAFGTTDERMGELLQSFGYRAEELSGMFHAVWNDTRDATAILLEGMDYTATEALNGVRSSYTEIVDGVEVALRDSTAMHILYNAKYYVNDIGSALKSVYSTSNRRVSLLLYNMGYTVNEVAGVLKSVWSNSSRAASDALRRAGYTATEVSRALKEVFSIFSTDTIADILRDAGYSASAVGSALRSVFDKTSNQVCDILKNAGYSAVDVAEAIKSVWDKSRTEVYDVLINHFSWDTVMAALDVVF